MKLLALVVSLAVCVPAFTLFGLQGWGGDWYGGAVGAVVGIGFGLVFGGVGGVWDQPVNHPKEPGVRINRHDRIR